MNSLRFTMLIVVLLLTATAGAAGSEDAATRPAERSDAATYIEESALVLEMARDGQFGRISSRDMQKLESAHARIVELLTPVQSPANLSPQLQQSLTLAQSQVDAIVRPEEDDRKICKRVAGTGTRLGALECLTVAERRQRARAARNMVNDAQRGFCTPGQDVSPCVFGNRVSTGGG